MLLQKIKIDSKGHKHFFYISDNQKNRDKLHLPKYDSRTLSAEDISEKRAYSELQKEKIYRMKHTLSDVGSKSNLKIVRKPMKEKNIPEATPPTIKENIHQTISSEYIINRNPEKISSIPVQETKRYKNWSDFVRKNPKSAREYAKTHIVSKEIDMNRPFSVMQTKQIKPTQTLIEKKQKDMNTRSSLFLRGLTAPLMTLRSDFEKATNSEIPRKERIKIAGKYVAGAAAMTIVPESVILIGGSALIGKGIGDIASYETGLSKKTKQETYVGSGASISSGSLLIAGTRAKVKLKTKQGYIGYTDSVIKSTERPNFFKAETQTTIRRIPRWYDIRYNFKQGRFEKTLPNKKTIYSQHTIRVNPKNEKWSTFEVLSQTKGKLQYSTGVSRKISGKKYISKSGTINEPFDTIAYDSPEISFSLFQKDKQHILLKKRFELYAGKQTKEITFPVSGSKSISKMGNIAKQQGKTKQGYIEKQQIENIVKSVEAGNIAKQQGIDIEIKPIGLKPQNPQIPKEHQDQKQSSEINIQQTKYTPEPTEHIDITPDFVQKTEIKQKQSSEINIQQTKYTPEPTEHIDITPDFVQKTNPVIKPKIKNNVENIVVSQLNSINFIPPAKEIPLKYNSLGNRRISNRGTKKYGYFSTKGRSYKVFLFSKKRWIPSKYAEFVSKKEALRFGARASLKSKRIKGFRISENIGFGREILRKKLKPFSFQKSRFVKIGSSYIEKKSKKHKKGKRWSII